MPQLSSQRCRSPLVALAAGLLIAPGCGDGRPAMDTSRTEIKVTGTVKIKGKPADKGEIVFDPSNAERQVGAFVAKVGPDGAYAITTYRGPNVVKFRGEMLKENPELALGSRFCEVGTGENVVDFDLLGADDQPRSSIYSRKKAPKSR